MNGPTIDPDSAEAFIKRAVAEGVRDGVRDALQTFAEFTGPYLTAAQAARYYGISLRLFKQLVAENPGALNRTRITPRAPRYERAALDTFARARTR